VFQKSSRRLQIGLLEMGGLVLGRIERILDDMPSRLSARIISETRIYAYAYLFEYSISKKLFLFITAIKFTKKEKKWFFVMVAFSLEFVALFCLLLLRRRFGRCCGC